MQEIKKCIEDLVNKTNRTTMRASYIEHKISKKGNNCLWIGTLFGALIYICFKLIEIMI